MSDYKLTRSKTMMIALAFFAIVTAVLIFAATKPDNFYLARSIAITAKPNDIFPIINDFHQWIYWSPWERKDPNMKRTYTGAQFGLGAVYAWEGDNNVGKGEMSIVESTSFDHIQISLHFIKPFEAHNTTHFTFTDTDGTTQVLWSMQGKNTFIGKIMRVFISMDKLVGKDFEQGLIQLKAYIENKTNDANKKTST